MKIRTRFFKNLMFYSYRIKHFAHLSFIIGVLLFILEYIGAVNYSALLIIIVSGLVLSIHYFLCAFVPFRVHYDLSIPFPELIDDEIYELKEKKKKTERKIKAIENEILLKYRSLNK